MKLVFTNILFLVFLCFGNAQVTMEPDCLILEADGIDVLNVDIFITNNGNEEVSLLWQFELALDFPEEWKFQIHDLALSYNWNDTQSSTSTFLLNRLQAGQTGKFLLRIESNQNDPDSIYNITGSSSGTLRLFDNIDFIDPIAETSCIVSNTNVEIEETDIYPNPTSDRFRLKNDANINSLRIYDIVGRAIIESDHADGKSHDISGLKSGIYTVRLMNDGGEIMKTVRLCKR